MTCYDHTQASRNVSMAASVAITRFTDPKEYEFIIVDTEPKYRFNYKPPVPVGTAPVKIDKFLELTPDLGYFASMNRGAEEAKGEYLCFIENDVFVTPEWLPNLRWYLENGYLDAVFPHQAPDSYETYLKYSKLPMEKGWNGGCEEQGLMLITREAFDKMGGWDKNFPVGIGWKNVLLQMHDSGIKFGSTFKSVISHICGMTYFNMSEFEREKFVKNTGIEAEYLLGK